MLFLYTYLSHELKYKNKVRYCVYIYITIYLISNNFKVLINYMFHIHTISHA